MASKGQKFNKYSSEVKKEILDKYFNGEGGSVTLGKEYNISSKTIDSWIRKIKFGKDVFEDQRPSHSGRKKLPNNMTLEDYKEQCEILKKYQAFIEARRGKK